MRSRLIWLHGEMFPEINKIKRNKYIAKIRET